MGGAGTVGGPEPAREPDDEDGWVIELADVRDPGCQALLREHHAEVSDRYHRLHDGRSSTPEEVEWGFARLRSDDLAPPTGAFLVARRADDPTVLAGCVGVRRVRDVSSARVAELRRLHVRPGLRRAGLGTSLLLLAEEVARVWGVTATRMVTCLGLVEARSLLEAQGYVEVPAFPGEAAELPGADAWFVKPLD